MGFDMKGAFRLAAGILGVTALVLQYALVLMNDIGPDPLRRTINFFSYFTILTNVLVVLALLAPVAVPQTGLGKFFARPGVRTAIASYIIIVSAVVFFILRHLTNLQGLDFLADLLLHYILPALFVMDWLFLTPKETLKFGHVAWWLVFPVIYLGWTFIHGAASGFFPYPFLNTNELGLLRVLINEGLLLVVFLILGFVLVTGGKMFRPGTPAP
jgi:hypothetical protein